MLTLKILWFILHNILGTIGGVLIFFVILGIVGEWLDDKFSRRDTHSRH